MLFTETSPSDESRLEGMADFLTVPYSHTWLMWRRPVIRQIVCFLQTGRFSHGEETPE